MHITKSLSSGPKLLRRSADVMQHSSSADSEQQVEMRRPDIVIPPLYINGQNATSFSFFEFNLFNPAFIYCIALIVY